MKKDRIPFILALAFVALAIGLNIQKPETKRTKAAEEVFHEDPREAINALQFFTTAAAFPGKDIPADAYTRAYTYYQEHFKGISRDNESWHSLGPEDAGGRTLSLAFDPKDPNMVWMGSAGGGLWKSATGGRGQHAWSFVPTGYPVYSVSSIAIDPSNTKVMYIGTGETYTYQGAANLGLISRPTRGTFGIGILKSSDGGRSWSKCLDWSYQQQRGIWEIIVNPLNSKTVYTATTEGLYKTTDAGLNWNKVLDVKMVMDIALDPSDTAILYAGAGNMNSANKGLYKTTDGGRNWALLTNGLPAGINTGRTLVNIAQSDPNIVMAAVYNTFNTMGIYKSTDKGKSWTELGPYTDVASYQGWYANGLLMKKDDPDRVLIGGVEMYRSETGGYDLFKVSNNNGSTDVLHSDIHGIIPHPTDAGTIYVLTDGGLYISDDFGDSYTESNSGYVTTQHYIGSVSYQDTTTVLSGLQDNNSIMRVGSAWYAVVGGDGCYNAINYERDDKKYAAYQYLNVMRTGADPDYFDSPILTSAASPEDNNNSAFLAPYLLCPSDPRVIYAAGDSMLRSDDGGDNFSVAGPVPLDKGNIILTIGVSATSTDTLYCATAPNDRNPMHVWRSTDGGQTYTNITGSQLPNRYPRRIAVNPHNSKELYIAYSGFGAGHIFKSSDAGASWTDISTSLPDVPFHVVLVLPENPDYLYAGSDLGAFISTDAGKTWTDFSKGFSDLAMVFDIIYSPVDHSLIAFTHGRGIFKYPLPLLTGIAPAHQSITKMNIYPVPANQEAHIQLTGTGKEDITVQAYTLDGRIAYQAHFSPGATLPLDVSRWEPGTYLVAVSQGNGRKVQKILVMH